MTDQAELYERLADWIVAGRVGVGLGSRRELAALTGLSARVIDDLENGVPRNYDRTTLILVELALGWEVGSIRREVLAGKRPETSELTEDERHSALQTWRDRTRDTGRRVAGE